MRKEKGRARSVQLDSHPVHTPCLGSVALATLSRLLSGTICAVLLLGVFAHRSSGRPWPLPIGPSSFLEILLCFGSLVTPPWAPPDGSVASCPRAPLTRLCVLLGGQEWTAERELGVSAALCPAESFKCEFGNGYRVCAGDFTHAPSLSPYTTVILISQTETCKVQSCPTSHRKYWMGVHTRSVGFQGYPCKHTPIQLALDAGKGW